MKNDNSNNNYVMANYIDGCVLLDNLEINDIIKRQCTKQPTTEMELSEILDDPYCWEILYINNKMLKFIEKEYGLR